MSTATVRISFSARDQLRDLASQAGKSMQAVVEEAIELYRRRLATLGDGLDSAVK